MEFESLSEELSSALGSVHFRTERPDRAVFALPNPRQTHDELVVSIEHTSSGWIASDLGATAFLLGEDFNAVVDAMVCGGAPFHEEDGVLQVLLSEGRVERISEEVAKFAANVSAAPLVWHSIACATPRREQTPSTTSLMAREARGAILQSVPRAEPFLALDVSVHGAMERVRAPLQFRTGSRSSPRLLAACIDYSAGPQAETAAKRLTSFLWDTVRELHGVQRYVIVRGSSQQIDRVAHLYDAKGVTALPSDDLRPLSASVAELVETIRS